MSGTDVNKLGEQRGKIHNMGFEHGLQSTKALESPTSVARYLVRKAPIYPVLSLTFIAFSSLWLSSVSNIL